MTWRHVLVYWAAALLLGGWLYLDARDEAAFESDTPVLAPLVAPTETRCEQVVVARGGTELRFVSRDGRWDTASPAGVRITSDLVAALLDTLSTIPPIERIEGESPEAPQYGLLPPRARVALQSAGKPAKVVHVGRRNPTGTAVYAALAEDDEVYLIGLNAQYYVELIFDELARQRGARGG